jgi:hypothetical protein
VNVPKYTSEIAYGHGFTAGAFVLTAEAVAMGCAGMSMSKTIALFGLTIAASGVWNVVARERALRKERESRSRLTNLHPTL